MTLYTACGACGEDVTFHECTMCDNPDKFGRFAPADEHLCAMCFDRCRRIEDAGPCPKCVTTSDQEASDA